MHVLRDFVDADELRETRAFLSTCARVKRSSVDLPARAPSELEAPRILVGSLLCLVRRLLKKVPQPRKRFAAPDVPAGILRECRRERRRIRTNHPVGVEVPLPAIFV